MHFRTDEAPTILESLTAAQMMDPAPVLSNMNQSKVIEALQDDKVRTETTWSQALEQALVQIKSYEQELLAQQMTEDDVQAVFILVLEDCLFKQHEYDLEDFKQTMVHHEMHQD